MTEQENPSLFRENAASADEFKRTIEQYGLSEIQEALLTTLYEAEAEDGYVSLSVLCRGIGLVRGGYTGYRILTDQVLCPFGYNKTPTWIEFKWIEVEHRKYEKRGEQYYRLADALRDAVGELLGK